MPPGLGEEQEPVTLTVPIVRDGLVVLIVGCLVEALKVVVTLKASRQTLTQVLFLVSRTL